MQIAILILTVISCASGVVCAVSSVISHRKQK